MLDEWEDDQYEAARASDPRCMPSGQLIDSIAWWNRSPQRHLPERAERYPALFSELSRRVLAAPKESSG
jgi:hypothetical protein